MKYKTVVLEYNPRAKKMAEEVEKAANEYAEKGWKLLTFSITLSAKTILVLKLRKQSNKNFRLGKNDIKNNFRTAP